METKKQKLFLSGTIRKREEITVTEQELQEMPLNELNLLERILKEKPPNANIEAWVEDESRLVKLLITPEVPSITTLR